MSRGEFGFSNSFGSIVVISVTVLICLLCLLLQLCKRFTRKADVEIIHALHSGPANISTVEGNPNQNEYTAQCAVGWNPAVTTEKKTELRAFPPTISTITKTTNQDISFNQCSIGWNPKVTIEKTTELCAFPPNISTVKKTTRQGLSVTKKCSIGWNPVLERAISLSSHGPIGFKPAVVNPKTSVVKFPPNPYAESILDGKKLPAKPEIVVKMPPKGIQLVPTPSTPNRQGWAQPGFTDQVIYSGPNRVFGWSKET